MSDRPPQRSQAPIALIVTLVVIVAVAAALLAARGTGGPGASPSGAPAGSASATSSESAGSTAGSSPSGAAGPAVPLTVGLGYIGSVQFAPFYLADQAGYYAEEGVDVTFQNEIDANLVPKVGQGNVDIGLSDGTSVIPAVSQGIPIRYLATIYARFPSIVFAKASSGINTAADLKGRKIGIPGRFGSSWVMLQALLDSAGLTPADVQIVEYPDFGQAAALAQGAVDAATGFANNEPIELELNGVEVVVLTIDDITPLPGPGLIAANATITGKHDAVAGFVRATLRAMNATAADPTVGLEAAIVAVRELGENRALQTAVLAATIEMWRPAGVTTSVFGAIDRDAWQKSIEYLTKLGMVARPVTVDELVTDEFVVAP
jgi:NitT/TauT family transport system substrate-binding protein